MLGASGNEVASAGVARATRSTSRVAGSCLAAPRIATRASPQARAAIGEGFSPPAGGS